ncbi:MAG TPA: NlpC/P60 family protein [Propionibacteriaceae bacterium]|nr:NlpC/P60 family protein [Propionibacteriaceae bacterium]
MNITARVASRAFEVGRAPSIGRSLRIAALGLASVALSTLLGFTANLPAAAEPPLTVAEARDLIAQLQTDAAAIDQQYTDVEQQIEEGRAQLRLKRADVQGQTEKVGRLKLQVGQIALAQFQNRSLDTAAHLFVTPDTEGFLSQISTVQKVSENQNSALQDYQQAQADLAALEHSAETDLAALGEKEKEIKSLAAASDEKLDQAKKVLARLTADQQKQLAEAEKKATAKANAKGRAATKATVKTNAESQAATNAPAKTNAESRAATEAPAGTNAERQAATKASPDSTRSSVTGSSKGTKALAYAKAQLGEPYARSGAGPSSWDCSGLTMMAWGSVGVSLPHSSRQQFSRGQAVAQSDLQLGDLVFFYSDIHHVGLYAGNGQVIHAPRPGKSVEYIKMSYMPYAGARRPG